MPSQEPTYQFCKVYRPSLHMPFTPLYRYNEGTILTKIVDPSASKLDGLFNNQD
jgi:hypothetical protein